MGRYDYYKSGDWNAECDVCGQKYKASKLKLRWDGLRVCPKDFEYRNPQDFVRGIKDNQSTLFSRPEPPDVFVAFNYTQFPSEVEFIYDFAHNDITKIINPHILMNDGINSEPINFFAVNNGPGYAPTVDDFALTESVSIGSQKNISESITETEVISKSLTKAISETLTPSDFVFFSDASAKADSIATTGDSEYAVFIKVLSDSITPSESVTFFLSGPQVLNGAAINNTTLG